MPRVAYEALMSRVDFDNPGRCLALVRQMLGSIRTQVANKRFDQCALSILLKADDAQDQTDDSPGPLQIETD